MASKPSTRKYSKAAGDKVGKVMHEMKRGTLRSGSNGKKVTNPKQAIAIGLAEARRDGKKAPPPPKKRAPSSRKASRKAPGNAAKKVD